MAGVDAAVEAVAGAATAGSAGVSSSSNTRSDDAIACCRVPYFSLRSEIGRKKRCVYWRNATSVPSVMPVHMTCRPPYQTMSDTASAPTSSRTGKRSAL